MRMRSKAWLATRVSLRLARLPRTASSAQRSRRLRSTRAAAPVHLAHTNVTKNVKYFSMGPKLRHPPVLGCDDIMCTKRTGAAASVERREIEPAWAISPECLARGSASAFRAFTHSALGMLK
jgi:hypothetical protein